MFFGNAQIKAITDAGLAGNGVFSGIARDKGKMKVGAPGAIVIAVEGIAVDVRCGTAHADGVARVGSERHAADGHALCHDPRQVLKEIGGVSAIAACWRWRDGEVRADILRPVNVVAPRHGTGKFNLDAHAQTALGKLILVITLGGGGKWNAGFVQFNGNDPRRRAVVNRIGGNVRNVAEYRHIKVDVLFWVVAHRARHALHAQGWQRGQRGDAEQVLQQVAAL